MYCLSAVCKFLKDGDFYLFCSKMSPWNLQCTTSSTQEVPQFKCLLNEWKLRKKARQKSKSPLLTPEETESTTYKNCYTLVLEINMEKEIQRQHVHRHVSHKPKKRGYLHEITVLSDNLLELYHLKFQNVTKLRNNGGITSWYSWMKTNQESDLVTYGLANNPSNTGLWKPQTHFF